MNLITSNMYKREFRIQKLQHYNYYTVCKENAHGKPLFMSRGKISRKFLLSNEKSICTNFLSILNGTQEEY